MLSFKSDSESPSMFSSEKPSMMSRFKPPSGGPQLPMFAEKPCFSQYCPNLTFKQVSSSLAKRMVMN